MALSDLRQRVRDRSVLIFGLAVPIILMFVFNLLFSGLGSSESLGKITAIVGITDAERKLQALSGAVLVLW